MSRQAGQPVGCCTREHSVEELAAVEQGSGAMALKDGTIVVGPGVPCPVHSDVVGRVAPKP